MTEQLTSQELQEMTDKKLELERKQTDHEKFIRRQLENIGIQLQFETFLSPNGLETIAEGETGMLGLIVKFSLNSDPAQKYQSHFTQHAIYKSCCEKRRIRGDNYECLFVVLEFDISNWQLIEMELYPLSDWLKKVKNFNDQNAGIFPTACCNSFSDFAEKVWPINDRGSSTIVLFLEKKSEINERCNHDFANSLATFVKSMTFTGYAGPNVSFDAPPRASGGGPRPSAPARSFGQSPKSKTRPSDSAAAEDVIAYRRTVTERLMVKKSPEEDSRQQLAMLRRNLEDPSNGFFGLDIPQTTGLLEAIVRLIAEQFGNSRAPEAQLISYLANLRLGMEIDGDRSSILNKSKEYQTDLAMREFARRHHVNTRAQGGLPDLIIRDYRFDPIAHVALDFHEELQQIIEKMAPHIFPDSFAATDRTYNSFDFLHKFMELKDDEWASEAPAGGDDGPRQRAITAKFVLQFLHTCTCIFKRVLKPKVNVKELMKLVKNYLKFCTDPFVYRFACNPTVFIFIQYAEFDLRHSDCPCQLLLNKAMDKYLETSTLYEENYGLWWIPQDIVEAMQDFVDND